MGVLGRPRKRIVPFSLATCLLLMPRMIEPSMNTSCSSVTG